VWRNAETVLARAKAAGGGRAEMFGAGDDAGVEDPGPQPEPAEAAAPQPGAA